MARQSEIPMRPKGRHYNLTDSEMDCLTWFVLSGCSRDYAYMTFVRPDLAINKRNLSTVSSQFFGSVDVRNYIEAYRSLIRGDVETIDDELCLDADSRKTKAVSKFTDKVVAWQDRQHRGDGCDSQTCRPCRCVGGEGRC